jgi:hypothetical protein
MIHLEDHARRAILAWVGEMDKQKDNTKTTT